MNFIKDIVTLPMQMAVENDDANCATTFSCVKSVCLKLCYQNRLSFGRETRGSLWKPAVIYFWKQSYSNKSSQLKIFFGIGL